MTTTLSSGADVFLSVCWLITILLDDALWLTSWKIELKSDEPATLFVTFLMAIVKLRLLAFFSLHTSNEANKFKCGMLSTGLLLIFFTLLPD